METEIKTFSEVFSDEFSYQVPPYQRKYSWGKGQLKVLFKDIEKILESKNEKELFLGFLIFFQFMQNKNLKIVDGQQRMITLSLLIMVIIKNLESVNNIEKNQKIVIEKELKQIITSDSSGMNLNLNFYPGEDQKIYQEIWSFSKKNKAINIKDKGKEWKTNSIWKAFKEIEIFFQKKLKNKVPKIIELITKKIKFLLIFLDTEDREKTSPQKIYETLNSTGQELKVSDLVKNYILSNLTFYVEKNMEEKLKMYWNKWVELLKNSEKKKGGLETFLDVLVHVILKIDNPDLKSLNKTQKTFEAFKSFFNKFELFEKPEDIDPYLEWLEKFIIVYSLISNNEFQSQEQKDLITWKKIKNKHPIQDINQISRLACFGWENKILSLFFSLLLERQIIDCHTLKNLIEFATIYELILRIWNNRIGQLSIKHNSFVTEMIEWSKVGNIDANFIFERPDNNHYIASSNEKQKLLNQKEILNYFGEQLKRRLKTEKTLFQYLKDLKNNNKSQKELIQSIIEQWDGKKPNDLFLISASIVKLTTKKFNKIKNPTIEHIFPKNGTNNFKMEKEWTENIGNIIFLEEEINKKSGNKELKEKIKIYKESKSTEVKKLIEYTEKEQIQEWNKEQIEKREEIKIKQFIEKIKSSGFLEYVINE